jgi:hypothetical protein
MGNEAHALRPRFICCVHGPRPTLWVPRSCSLRCDAGRELAPEELVIQIGVAKDVPQGLKPDSFYSLFGTTQATPATKTCRWGPREVVP